MGPARRLPGHAVRMLGLLLTLALALAGPAPARAVRDMLDHDVALASPPARIVSLVPSATEILFALGAADRLVAVTDFCDYPPEARSKPSVGGMVSPSLETIAALRPDVVIATDAGNRDETRTQLDRLRIPVYVVHAARVAEVMEVIRRLGALTGRGAAAGALIARLQGRIDAVRAAVAARPRPRVLYVLWPEPLIVPAREALVTELIALAGGDSVTAGEPGDYPRFSVEAAVARAPEIIVLPRHATGTAPGSRDRWERLTSLPAVRSGRLQEVSGDVLHRYGPRMVDGLEQLARVFHPEAFR